MRKTQLRVLRITTKQMAELAGVKHYKFLLDCRKGLVDRTSLPSLMAYIRAHKRMGDFHCPKCGEHLGVQKV